MFSVDWWIDGVDLFVVWMFRLLVVNLGGLFVVYLLMAWVFVISSFAVMFLITGCDCLCYLFFVLLFEYLLFELVEWIGTFLLLFMVVCLLVFWIVCLVWLRVRLCGCLFGFCFIVCCAFGLRLLFACLWCFLIS